MLYLFNEIEKLDNDFSEQAASLLSEERQKRVSAYRFPSDKNLSAAVYLLLCLALKKEHGINENIEFEYGKNGKPYLRDYPHIFFNLSHCKRAAACVVSDGEAGVDVQEIAPVKDSLARRVFTEREYAEYKASERPDEYFCGIWVKKESWLKQTGRGIGTDLAALEADSLHGLTLFGGDDFRGCVSGVSAPVTPVYVTLSMLEKLCCDGF
jgi:4'-phosphopantetheinyl transferase